MLYNQLTSKGAACLCKEGLGANLQVVVAKRPKTQAGGAPGHNGAPRTAGSKVGSGAGEQFQLR